MGSNQVFLECPEQSEAFSLYRGISNLLHSQEIPLEVYGILEFDIRQKKVYLLLHH